MADNEILNSTAVDASNEYDASEIQVLEGLEPGWKHPFVGPDRQDFPPARLSPLPVNDWNTFLQSRI